MVTNLSDYEQQARRILPAMVYDYYAGGACDEQTLRDNIAAFARLRLMPRVLRGVGASSERDTSVTLLTDRYTMPIGIAPMALQRMAHPEGELAMARAAALAGALLVISTTATASVEEVMAETRQHGGAAWFQLYMFQNREASVALIARAEQAGCKALVLTADTPYLGRRERDIRNEFHLPDGLEVKNYAAVDKISVGRVKEDSGLARHFGTAIEPSLRWDDVDWLRAQTSLPVLIKGVLHPADAAEAVRRGAAGIIVSNHGGRQLDSSIATIDALPTIVESVRSTWQGATAAPDSLSAPKSPKPLILLDGGVRRGTDVLKALALGADAILIGRPLLWALAVAGEQGVRAALELIHVELQETLGLAGCQNLHDISRDLVV